LFSDELEQYFKYIATLKYVEIPDYNKLRKIFQDGLRKRKFTDDGQTVKFKTADGASSSNDDAMEDCLNDSVNGKSFHIIFDAAFPISLEGCCDRSNKLRTRKMEVKITHNMLYLYLYIPYFF
jgi:hypothetical protein